MAIEGVANTEYASLTGKIRTFVVDKTLTISGACADAKATGEAIDSALDGALFEAKAVRKTGDTMTGDLTFTGQATPRIIMQKSSGEGEGIVYPGKNNMAVVSRSAMGDDTNRRALYIYNGTNATIDKALRLLEVVDGVEKWYDLIHTGNFEAFNNARVVAGTYTGGMTGKVTITVGFRPKFVMIWNTAQSLRNTPVVWIVQRSNTTADVLHFQTSTNAPGYRMEQATLSANGFGWPLNYDASDQECNAAGVEYGYIAIG